MFYLIILLSACMKIIVANTQPINAKLLDQRFATPCTTPNNDVGLCVEVQACKVFINALSTGKNSSFEFIRNSRCGPMNEDQDRPKVCCGAYDDYLTIPTAASTRQTTPVTVLTSTATTPITSPVTSPTDSPIDSPTDSPTNSTTSPPLTTTVRTSSGKRKKPNPFPKTCGNQTLVFPTRIFGGTVAVLGEFPWIARLRHRRKDGLMNYGCAGFLITPHFVLSAAHCIMSKALLPLGPLYQVQLGEHNINVELDCVGHPSNSICADPPQILLTAPAIVHPEYSNNVQQHNDIALVPLKEEAQFTPFVYPICLAKTESRETEMWLSGWGKTETREQSSVKLKVAVPRVKREKCVDQYISMDVKILDSQLCAGGEAGKDSCSGDSGGPLMVQQGVDPWKAEGIVSFGLACGLEGWPGVYTSVPFYRPWIKKTINRYLKQQQSDEGNGQSESR